MHPARPIEAETRLAIFAGLGRRTRSALANTQRKLGDWRRQARVYGERLTSIEWGRFARAAHQWRVCPSFRCGRCIGRCLARYRIIAGTSGFAEAARQGSRNITGYCRGRRAHQWRTPEKSACPPSGTSYPRGRGARRLRFIEPVVSRVTSVLSGGRSVHWGRGLLGTMFREPRRRRFFSTAWTLCTCRYRFFPIQRENIRNSFTSKSASPVAAPRWVRSGAQQYSSCVPITAPFFRNGQIPDALPRRRPTLARRPG